MRDKVEKIEKHEYEYGGFEVMGDCGKCGHVHDDPIHLNLYSYMGGVGQPEILSEIETMYHFDKLTVFGRLARYARAGGLEPSDVYYMDRGIFERMGQPSHVKVRVLPVHPNGLKVHDE